MKRTVCVMTTMVAMIGMTGFAASADALSPSGAVHACIGAGGLIRVRARCAGKQQAVNLTLSPIASAAAVKKHKASALIAPKSITGALIKAGSVPASDLELPIQGSDIGNGIDGDDIKAGTLPFSALSSSLKTTFSDLLAKQIPAGPKGPAGPPGSYTVGSGLQQSGNTLAIDPAVVQHTLTAGCNPGEFVSSFSAQGVAACATPSGPSTDANTGQVTLSSTTNTPIAHLTIPATGTYLVSAVVPLEANDQNEGIQCSFSTGDANSIAFYLANEDPIPTVFAAEAYFGQSTFSLQTTEALLAGTVTLYCASTSAQAPVIGGGTLVSFAATPTTEQ